MYEEDRTFFFLFVDSTTNAVVYVDFGGNISLFDRFSICLYHILDLIAMPTGRIVAWNFRSYLSNFAKKLQINKVPYPFSNGPCSSLSF